jgi:hypothetical protein
LIQRYLLFLLIHGFGYPWLFVLIAYQPIVLRAQPQIPALCPGGQIFIIFIR